MGAVDSKNYAWQNRAEGYKLYQHGGENVLVPGSREVTDGAITVLSDSKSPTYMRRVTRDFQGQDIWGQAENPFIQYRKGDIQMYYGRTDWTTSPYWKADIANGNKRGQYDFNRSAAKFNKGNLQLMEQTHVDSKGNPLKIGTEWVKGFKKAFLGATVLPKGTPYINSDMWVDGLKEISRTQVGEIMLSDPVGNYVVPLKQFTKKHVGIDEASSKLMAKAKQMQRIMENAPQYLKDGQISAERAEKAINGGWKAFVEIFNELRRIHV